MAKDFAKRFYNSSKWRSCRAAYIAHRIKVDGGLCEECGKRLGFIVHHKTMLTQKNISDSKITLDFGNLSYVCKECHDREKEHAFIKHKALICGGFDSEGQPLPRNIPPLSEI